MAEVWLATDLELVRPVALKLLAADADRDRFKREARAVAALAHPNVTRLYDYGEVEGRPYMAFEYLGGGTLEERLPPGRRLEDEETRAIAVQLAAGLAHAHAHGLVHRDLKPANILFDDEDRPKIADFGIARMSADSTLTEAGTVLGTAAYISPEQAEGEPATSASDVYSFGVVLFRMLTGRLPFESEQPLELVDMHRRLQPPAVEILRPDAPADLAALAGAALAKDPRERPPDGAALTEELGVEQPAAAGATSAETLVLPRRPRRVRLALAFLALVFAAAAGTAGAFFLTRGQSSPPAVTHPTHAKGSSTTPARSPSSAPASTRRTTSAPKATTAPPPVTIAPPTITIPATTAITSLTTTTAAETTAPTTAPDAFLTVGSAP
jgi:eukaryotic-like serine/threonine-protein kinase